MSRHVPRKRFGQNFLHERHYIEQIVAAVDPRPGQRVVEIGPGEGALTREILRRVSPIDAIELDRDLCHRLTAEFGTALRLHSADALKFDFAALAGGDRLRIIGNLPYNISSPLLFHLLRQSGAIEDMHFMLQKEVVERCCAEPGSKTYGRLSVMLQHQCEVAYLFEVPPGAFRPPPKVDSAVMRLRPRIPQPDAALLGRMSAIVRDAFAARRKTLRNTLSAWFSPAQMQQAGIDPQARAEQLSPENFADLATLATGKVTDGSGTTDDR